MSSRSLRPQQPTASESQAHLEAVEHFADHLKQFSTCRDHVTRLERDIAKLALAAMAVSRKPSDGELIQADDGQQWHKAVALYDNVCICHRQALNAMEFAVVERFPSGSNEIWTKGRNAVEVLKAFIHDQRHALSIWVEDINAQVKGFLAEKYPGQNMDCVAETFMQRLDPAQYLNPRQNSI